MQTSEVHWSPDILLKLTGGATSENAKPGFFSASPPSTTASKCPEWAHVRKQQENVQRILSERVGVFITFLTNAKLNKKEREYKYLRIKEDTKILEYLARRGDFSVDAVNMSSTLRLNVLDICSLLFLTQTTAEFFIWEFSGHFSRVQVWKCLQSPLLRE